LVERSHYSSLGKGRFGAALAFSLLAHVLPVTLLARIYLAESAADKAVFSVIGLPSNVRHQPQAAKPPLATSSTPIVSNVQRVSKAEKPMTPPTSTSMRVRETESVPQPRTYFSSQQVDQPADMLVPLDPSFFSDDFTLSGSVVLEVAVNSVGSVDRIDVLSTKGDDGRFKTRIIEWLQNKRFNPARKDGKPVDSLFRFELNLERVEKPFEGVPDWPPPGHLPKLDAKGNPIPDRPPVRH
jgi:outer membrane biosynthesis protein TonB